MRTLASLLLVVLSVLPVVAAEDYPTPPRDKDSGKFAYQEVVQAEDATADDLYSRARAWQRQPTAQLEMSSSWTIDRRGC